MSLLPMVSTSWDEPTPWSRRPKPRMAATVMAVVLSSAPSTTAAQRSDTTVRTPAADTIAFALIGPEGGTLELAGVARVRVPARAFSDRQRLSLVATLSEGIARSFEATVPIASVVRGDPAIRLITGEQRPEVPLEIVIEAPEAIASAWRAGQQPSVFAQVWQDGGAEILDGFVRIADTQLDRAAGTLSVVLPPHLFTDRRRSDGRFEAVLVVAAASLPQARRSHSAAADPPAAQSAVFEDEERLPLWVGALAGAVVGRQVFKEGCSGDYCFSLPYALVGALIGTLAVAILR